MTTLNGSSSDSDTTGITIADVFLEALARAGIDYLFTVLGSDHPSIIEAYVRRKNEGKEFPKMLIFLHEMVAISAADGYARVTRRPQCVIVHVDVGTSALGQGLHNASSGKSPILIFAGQAPFSIDGDLAGARTEHVQWYQDVHGQADIVAPYARYLNEIKSANHVEIMVNRALLMASTGSCGPAYLTATREVLAAPVDGSVGSKFRDHIPSCTLGGLPEADVNLVAEVLMQAEKPLVVTGYLGRVHAAVHRLVSLADMVPGLRVFDFEAREMSFPANHRAHITRATGAALAIREADIILVLDCDVPWIPTKVRPSPTARIFHIDVDPRKEKMQLFDIFAEKTYNAECTIVLQQLLDRLSLYKEAQSEQAVRVSQERWDRLSESFERGRTIIEGRAGTGPDGSITNTSLFAALKRVLPEDTIYVSDVVTNQVPFMEQLQLTTPGSHISKGGSGLGWAGGAAIGVRLALDRWDTSDRPNCKLHDPAVLGGDKSQPVCCVTGDGSFIFGVPSAVYWAQYKLNIPFLTIIVNNGGWKATRSCINDVHPGGVAAALDDEGLGIDLKLDGPDYVGIAVAASNNTLCGRRVSKAAELDNVLREMMSVVQLEKRGALLEVVLG